MNSLTEKELTLEDFSTDYLNDEDIEILNDTIKILNKKIITYNTMKIESIVEAREIWGSIIQLLPQSYMQLRTVQFNYETAFIMFKQRHNHKLREWRNFCMVLLWLPHFKDITDYKSILEPYQLYEYK